MIASFRIIRSLACAALFVANCHVAVLDRSVAAQSIVGQVPDHIATGQDSIGPTNGGDELIHEIDDEGDSLDQALSLSGIIAESGCCNCESDRVFLLSTRHLSSDPCRISLERIPFRMWRIDSGAACAIDLMEYQASLSVVRPVVIYVHGNRMKSDEVLSRSSDIRRKILCNGGRVGIDWIVYSWPSDQERIGVRDFRIKADRCDAQGLYLAAFLRQHAEASIPIAMIGYSFGARVATGSLHALAGGVLSGRRLPDPPIIGANVRVGLVAPAIESEWLAGNGYHAQATKNMDELLLLYNQRDIVLKRYWLLDKMRRDTALGYSGPTCFAPRVDGTALPVRSRDCSPIVKLRHSELDYYQGGCNAGHDMAKLINGLGCLYE